jgi:hypothetical protein
MPYHTKKKDDKPKMIIVIKKNKKRELKPEEKDLFKIHAKIHSKAHVDFMKKFIKDGKGCYSDSHKAALKAVGK